MKLTSSLIIAAIIVLLGPSGALAQSVVQVPSADQSYTLHFPSDPQGAITRARQLVAQGKIAEAITWLSRYDQVHPREIAPNRFLGDLYFRNGDVKHAITLYLNVVREFPDDRETHDRLGVAYATQHRIDDAIAEFMKSLPSTNGIRDLATLHRIRGDFPQFRDSIEDAAVDHPFDAVVLDQLGELDLADSRPADATRAFARSLRNRPGFEAAENGLGLAAMAEHQYNDAVSQLRECVKEHSDYYPCWTNLGASYLHLHELAQAQSALSQARRIEPDGSEALVNLGYLADERGAWKSAVSYYAQAIMVGPYTPEAYIDVGLDYIGHRMYGLAEAALTKGVAFTPYDGRIHVLLGDVYKEQGQTNLAALQYHIAVESTNENARNIAQDRLDRMAGIPTPR
ncbi:MAG: tetratricopeptide repeat protein [Vulcanimicrobiaceae bacterium]